MGGLLITSLLYTIQLYCDFSGFADITIGISGLFGIKLEENFNNPYISSSIPEFWRRWHITLGRWFKKYVYIPLGGNRVPIWRWVINTLIVWLLSGIWHGANWTFILWGLFNGILIVLYGLPTQIAKKKGTYKQRKKQKPIIKILLTILTFIVINFTWILFRSQSVKEAGTFLVHMLQAWHPSSYSMFSDSTLKGANNLLILSIILLFILVTLKILKFYKDKIIQKFQYPELVTNLSKYALTIGLFSVVIYSFISLNGVGGGESSFIYFDF